MSYYYTITLGKLREKLNIQKENNEKKPGKIIQKVNNEKKQENCTKRKYEKKEATTIIIHYYHIS